MAVWAPMQKGMGSDPVFSTENAVEKPFSSSRWVTFREKGKG